MGTASLPQAVGSTYQWGDLLDFIRRRGANAGTYPAADQLKIVQAVSAYAYTKYLWPFTFATTPLGSIQCVNGQQDYPQPSDCYRLSRAWLYVPTQVYSNANSYGPVDDPSAAALVTTALSVAYVNAQSSGGGTPAGITWPPAGSLNVVKRLSPNRIMRGYSGIRAITQQPNSNMLRLDWATAVASTQPYSLELEYQLQRPVVNALTEYLWMPDDYVRMAEEGILYYLYKYNNDERAGTVSIANGSPVYSGQYAVWQEAMETAAAQDRAGSVDSITPTESLGANYYNGGWPY